MPKHLITGSNGLTHNTGNVKLGGNLANNTLINGLESFNMTFQDVALFSAVSMGNISFNAQGVIDLTAPSISIPNLADVADRMLIINTAGVVSTQPIPAGGLVDGGYGDIDVSGSGTTMTINPDTVTVGKISATGTASATTYLRGDGSWSALDADLTAIADLVGTSGLLKKTAADTWTLDTNTYALASSVPTNNNQLTNGSNYITLSSAITGYAVGTNTALVATDTLLDAFGKVQGQINNLATKDISGLTTNRIPYANSATTITDSANLLWDNTAGALVVGGGSNIDAQTLLSVNANANNAYSYSIKNASTGNKGASEIVANADTGTLTTNFMAVGINNTGFSDAAYTIMPALSGYLFTNGGDLTIGTQSAKDVVFHTNGTLAAQERMRITSTGTVKVAGMAGSNSRMVVADTSGNLSATDNLGTITFIIDGGGAAITTGFKGYLEIPFACTILGWTLMGETSGSITVDIWKDTYANFAPTVADTITGSAKPLYSSAVKGQSSTLTGWTTSIAAGDILAFNVDSVTSVTRVTLSLKIRK